MDVEREMKSKLLSAKKAGKIEEIVETLSLQDKEQALIVAAECGFTEVVKYLIDQGIIFHDADSCQKNMLHILLSSFRSLNEPGLLQYVVKIVNNGVDVNQLNKNKDTPISIAAEKGLYDVVRYLLEQGADVHYGNSYQDNFLHRLFYYYDRSFIFGRCDLLQCVIRLIDAGVDVNQLNKDKVTPIVIAAWRGLYDVLVYMLEHGGNKHCVDSHQNNLLYILLSKFEDWFDNKNDLLRCVIKLVDAGVDVNQLNGDEDTPILMASRKGLCDIVIYLLEHEVDVHCVDSHQNNMMHLLVYSEREREMGFNVVKIQTGHFGTNVYNYASDDNTGRRDLLLKCVVKLVDAGVDVNQSNKDKETPIVIAAKAGLCDVVMCLLEQGVELHSVDSPQNNLMILLLKSYSRYYPHPNKGRRDLLPCVVKLMDAGVDVNQVNEDIVTPIYIATIEGSYEPGVDANLRHEGKDTPIFIAARKGLYEVVIYLLEHGGVDVKYVDSHQDNLIHTLFYYYDSHYTICSRDLFLQCVVRLVDAGVDVNEPNKYKDTPISIVARKGLYEVVLYLLYHGVDVHYVDSHQKNLIHILLDSYHRYDDTIGRHAFLLPCIVKLVDDGVDVNQPNGDKETPIFIAAREGLSDIVIYLLQNGVDVHYVDDFKLNILHYMLSGMYSSVQDEEKTISLVNTLINMGSHVNQPDHKGNTPLFYVGRYNHSDDNTHFKRGKAYEIQSKLETGLDMQAQLINILLEAGCNANHQNEDERTALMHHIKHQADISILKLLIPYSDLSLTDNTGNTAISCCVQYHMFNSTIVFKLLVDSGSDLMSRSNGVKLFHDILKCKRLWLFSNYIRLKLIVNGVTAEGENMLHLLARVNYDYSPNKFNWLLNNELDINHPCFKPNAPTMIAAFLLNSKYLELLTRHPRLDINAQNNKGHTALHLCIIGFTMFKDGLNSRQSNDVVTNYCRQIYPIYIACIDTLLGVDGIDVNIKDHRGRTSLMMAAMKNDRVLTRKLLQTGAIVSLLDYSGRSALQYLDIYQSVFDLTCFKLLLSNGNTGLLNLPCIDGNTIIQTALCFPFFWEPCRVVRFIRYLVAENCCVQTLVTSSVESSYKQINLTELSSTDRDKLRKLLYVSGAKGEDIMTILNFDEEGEGSQDNDTIRARGKEQFVSFCSSISLKSLCRRNIRQNLGFGIKEKVKVLELPYELNDFLLLNDVLHPQDYDLDHIDDGCKYFDDDDDYDGYDIDDRDDDYSQYDYQYFTLNTDHELRQSFKENFIFPNGGHGGLDDDDDDDNDDNADDDYSIYG